MVEERRWIVYVCPNCGRRKAGVYFCRCVIPSSRCEKVEVVEASKLKEQEERCERLEEALRSEIEKIREHARRLRAEDFDPDVLPAAMVQIADRLAALQHSPGDEGAGGG